MERGSKKLIDKCKYNFLMLLSMKYFHTIEECEAMKVYGGLSDRALRELMELIGELLGAGLKYFLDWLNSQRKPKTYFK